MRAFLSSIGTRGDVQPLLAVALELKSLGHEARMCVAPNFKAWIETAGVECVPIGPDLRAWTARPPAQPLTPEQLKQLAADGAVRPQFAVMLDGANGCDVMLGAGALQFAAPSIAEKRGVPYAFVSYCPAVFPSNEHPPVKINERFAMDLGARRNRGLWQAESARWDELFLAALNGERAKLELDAVPHAHAYVVTPQPWLAADAALGPAPGDTSGIFQTGAWILPEQTRLPERVEKFLAEGPPPVYFGFGSMRSAAQASEIVAECSRTLGVRAIVSRGWGNLEPPETPELLVVDDVPHATLFPRMAAIVHHGGAGTTAAAGLAGRPQVLVPHNYDQFYWAHRVAGLGLGAAGPAREALDARALIDALKVALSPATATRAAQFASVMSRDGARVAARRLIELACG